MNDNDNDNEFWLKVITGLRQSFIKPTAYKQISNHAI